MEKKLNITDTLTLGSYRLLPSCNYDIEAAK